VGTIKAGILLVKLKDLQTNFAFACSSSGSSKLADATKLLTEMGIHVPSHFSF
jgi:hypothetical protein